MFREDQQNRRQFITNTIAATSALGTGLFISSDLFADRTQLAARIAETSDTHPLKPALKLASESLASLNEVKDYTAIFNKRERVGRSTIKSRMDLKLRENPFSVYLKFLSSHAGREVVYVAGRNNNQLQVHDVGFASLAGTISLDPTGSFAMDENRYPVTSIGMRHMLVKLVETWLAGSQLSGISANIYPNAHIGNLPCKGVEVSFQRNLPGAKFQMTRLYIDREKGWPIRVQAYDFPGRREKKSPLVEDYYYSNIKANVGLTDLDFSTKNPKYGF